MPDSASRSDQNVTALFFGHATGFPCLAYRSLLAELAQQHGFVVIGYDLPGFGESSKPAETFRHKRGLWEHYGDRHADHFLTAKQALQQRGLPVERFRWIFLGHSMGAWLSVWAAAKSESLDVIALDLVWLPVKYALPWALFAGVGLRQFHPVGKSSASRRVRFTDKDEAKTLLQRKRLFRGFSEQMMVDYIDAMFEQRSDGAVLKHDPVWEAAMFRSQPAAMKPVFRKLAPDQRAKVEGVYVVGEQSDVSDPQRADGMLRLFPGLDLQQVGGAGHMFPLTAPEQTTELIAEYAGRTAKNPSQSLGGCGNPNAPQS